MRSLSRHGRNFSRATRKRALLTPLFSRSVSWDDSPQPKCPRETGADKATESSNGASVQSTLVRAHSWIRDRLGTRAGRRERQLRVTDNERVVEITGVLCCVVLAGYWAGSPLAKKCLFISYQMGPDAYSKGVDDAYFVGFWIVAFTFLRAAVMKYLFHPLAKTLGIEPFGKRQRFAEQGFMFAYYAIYWNLGMVGAFLFTYIQCYMHVQPFLCSISCTSVPIGSTLRSFGSIIRTLSWNAAWNTITWHKWPFGSNSSIASRQKSGERTIMPCFPIIS